MGAVTMHNGLRSRAMAERVSYLYACALVTVLYLFLPYGGYARMMEGKYICFLALSLGYLAAMAAVVPRQALRIMWAQGAAGVYLACTALSALCSPYGAAVLLGGTRRDGLLTQLIYVATFWLLSCCLRPDRRLLYLTAFSVTLGSLLTLAQTAGYDPLRLYPAGLSYHDGDAAYAGFFAGTSGNVNFTAYLLALAACVLLAAVVRERLWWLAAPAALSLWTLYRLGVAAAVLGLALLFPQKRRWMLLLSAALSIAALLLLRRYDGGGTLGEAARLLRGEAEGGFGSGRLAIWRDCLPLVRARPLLGGGPGTFYLRGVEPFVWYRDGAATPVDITAAHNEYLHLLVDQGALALSAYLALVLGALGRCFRNAREARFALCGMGLLCGSVMACFTISTCITAPYFWLLIVMSVLKCEKT